MWQRLILTPEDYSMEALKDPVSFASHLFFCDLDLAHGSELCRCVIRHSVGEPIALGLIVLNVPFSADRPMRSPPAR